LVALGRSRQGKVWEARSEDNGRTWGEMSLIDLPNPNSGTDAVTLKDGRQVLVFNDTPKGRTPLTVAVKSPGGEWKRVVTLEDQPGEYSYPAVIQSVEGELHITYTWKRLLVRHVIVDPAKF
jgi:alpha-L-rhamnosidase